MKETTYTAAGDRAAPNHAKGYRFDPAAASKCRLPGLSRTSSTVPAPSTRTSRIWREWVSLQLGGRHRVRRPRIVSAENLAYTHTPKVAISQKVSYALGWTFSKRRKARSSGTMVEPTASARWSSSSSTASSASSCSPTRKYVGMPDAIGLWTSIASSAIQWSTTVHVSLAGAKQGYADSVEAIRAAVRS